MDNKETGLYRPKKFILVDINTQRDLFLAKGVNCVINNHTRALKGIRRVMAWARLRNIPIISICRVITERGNGYTQKIVWDKIRYTINDSRYPSKLSCSTDIPIGLLREYRQVIVYSRSPDPFDEDRIDRMINDATVKNFVLIGAPVEEDVKYTALGLLARRRSVTVLADALGRHDKEVAETALRVMEARGAVITTARKHLGKTRLRRVGICGCEKCSKILETAGSCREIRDFKKSRKEKENETAI